MKKIKSWYIKLAFAALFFTLIAEAITGKTIVVSVSTAVPVATAESIDHLDPRAEIKVPEPKNIEAKVNTPVPNVVKVPPPSPEPAKRILVNNKTYEYNLVIPSLKINAGVLGMGLDSGKMAVPNNFTEVGWYNLGTRPGEMGSAVMGAHVDNGGKVNGVFKNLKNLVIGDDIYIDDSKGTTYHYKVTERNIYPYQMAITNEVFLKNDAKRLNLITCYGSWLPGKNTYDRRLVVFAELIEPALP